MQSLLRLLYKIYFHLTRRFTPQDICLAYLHVATK